MIRCLVAVAALLGVTESATFADEAQTLVDIKAFFATEDLDEREAIAGRIESDPDYDREQVGQWLNAAELFEPLDAGTSIIRVPLDNGETRSVALRVPAEYDHKQAWPLIYALHGTNGTGEGIIRYIEHVLGDDVERFVVAAPTGYGQAVIHSKGTASAEHPIVWHALKRKVHVDSDRVYVMGYSLGGHTSWTLAVLHADQFAAALPTAGTFFLPDLEQLWPPFLPNLAHLHVLNVWGANDVYGSDGVTPSAEGGIAATNRTMRKTAAESGLDVVSFEHPEKGHGDITAPRELLLAALSKTREQYPANVEHSYRYAYQGRAYWIEVHDWTGSNWSGPDLGKLDLRSGEDPLDPETQHNAMRRMIRARLGQIRGSIDGQKVDVRRKHFKECTIWFGEGMINWERPVVVKVSGRKAFEGKLEPDLFVCLSQAARTHDLQRLRWAGLRYRSGSKTRPVTGRTEFPD